MINVVHRADALAQLQGIADGCVKVFRIKRALLQISGIVLFVQLDVELQASYAAEVILARVKEHAMEQRSGGIQGGRIAGAQLAVDLDQGFLRGLHGIAAQGGADYVAYIVALREEDVNLFHACIHEFGELV